MIAQGTEGGGHTGEIGSTVLWPEVIDAVAPTPVLAAGGIGTGRQMAAALAMGAEGVWTGSLWLTVEEADVPPAQMQSLLRRRRAATPCGRARGRASRAACCATTGPRRGRREGTPEPLGMPLQFMVTSNAVQRGHKYPEQAKDVQFNPVGQIVGRMDKVRPVARRDLRPGRGVHRRHRAAHPADEPDVR